MQENRLSSFRGEFGKGKEKSQTWRRQVEILRSLWPDLEISELFQKIRNGKYLLPERIIDLRIELSPSFQLFNWKAESIRDIFLGNIALYGHDGCAHLCLPPDLHIELEQQQGIGRISHLEKVIERNELRLGHDMRGADRELSFAEHFIVAAYQAWVKLPE